MPAPLGETTAAVLVVYRVEQPLDATLAALARQLRLVVVVDNATQPRSDVEAAARRHGAVALRGGNAGALAGAYNRALDHIRAGHGGIRHVVLLDEDSDVGALGAFIADDAVAELLADERTAAVAPAYRERATGLRGKYIELQRYRLRYLEREFRGVRRVAFVINSMSVWRMAALVRIGPFDERLALDHVDTEYCLRARQLGLALYVHGSHEFAHSIGERRRFRFLGREMQAGGHSPERRYLIGRNTSWLARSWWWREPAFAFLCLTRLAYEAVGILAIEDDAWRKLRALCAGAAVGLATRRAA